MRVVHVSDIHLTSVCYKSEWGGKLISAVSSLGPDVLLVTGDLTHDGYMHEYEVVKDFFEKLEVDNRIVLPGTTTPGMKGISYSKRSSAPAFLPMKTIWWPICGIDSSEPI